MFIMEDTITEGFVTERTTTIVDILTGQTVIIQELFVLGLCFESRTTFLL
jgi:hypothetical protein